MGTRAKLPPSFPCAVYLTDTQERELGNGMARSHQTTARNQTTSVFVVAFAASVLLWPTLIAASWLYMPAPIAAMNSAVHLVGMIATAGPSIAYLCSSVARARKRRVPLSFTRRPDSGGSPFFPSRVEAREEPLNASRITSLDSGSIPLNLDHLDLPTFWRRIDRGPAAGFEDAETKGLYVKDIDLDFPPVFLSDPDPEEAA